MNFTYKPSGVCAQKIELELENGVVRNVRFTGGCDGNHKGICSLVEGMPAQEAAQRLSGIHCGQRSTSCPDQLSKAIASALAAK